MPRKGLTAALGCVLATVWLHAQAPATPPPPQEPTPTFRTGVDVLTVDVAALDRNGRPVNNLRAPDFSVRIDGQPRRVVSVELVKFDVEADRRAQAAQPFESFFSTNQSAPSGRLIVLAVDQLNIQPGNARQLLLSASRFLDGLSPLDRVAFFAYPAPGAEVDFTTDRERVRKAMELTVGAAQRFENKFNIGLYEAIQSILKDDEVLRAAVLARECRRQLGQALDECIRQVTSEMALMVNRVREDRVRSVGSLQRLLEGLAQVDAPKSLILMSEGLILLDESDTDGVQRAAARARTSINVLLMDVPRGSDFTRGAVMPPTMTEDRALQTNGLRGLAGVTRGSVFMVSGTGATIFERLMSEMSAYYLLGVEEAAGDRDDKPHRIDVEVLRQGVTIRSRRAFVLSQPAERTPGQRLAELIRAPFGVSEVPMRLTTFAVQDGNAARIRLLLAADVGQAGSPAGTYTVGWTLVDSEGRAVVSGAETKRLDPLASGGTGALDYRAQAVVDPGVYSLRLAVIDEQGRRGAIVREVNAWKMAGEEFAVADLVVGAPPSSGQTLLATVEPQVDTAVAAVVEIYSTDPSSFARTKVRFEIAEQADGPALLEGDAEMLEMPQATAKAAQTVLNGATLAPGRYVMRARIARNGTTAGVLTRPFVLVDGPMRAAAAAAATPRASLTVPSFDRALATTPVLLAELFSAVDKRSPALKDAMIEARAGRYGAASLEALGAGDQEVAAFLKGLDFYLKNQMDQAATQFNVAAGPRREFFPAAFLLGAALASAGRDRDAAGVWQMSLGTESRPALAYTWFADARLRDGQPQSVVDVLQPLWQRRPTDDEIGRRLAHALVLSGKYADSLPVFEGYLSRHPAEQDVLWMAIQSQYEATTRAGSQLSSTERPRLTGWARAYTGPQRAQVERYLQTLR